MSILGRGLGEIQGGMAQGMAAQFYEQQRKDPTVSDAQDAVHALEKRKTWLKEQLAQVAAWEKELKRVEAMIAAGSP